jgi:hypothetical protein
MEFNKIGLLLAGVLVLWGNRGLHAQDVLSTGLEQLSALQGYIHTAEDGYRIVTDGLRLAGDVKGGEFNLHRIFFSSLKEVDEAVINNPELKGAYEEVARTTRVLDQALKTYAASGWLQPGEMQYLVAVEQKVTEDGRENLSALETIAKDGTLSMTDGQRLGQIQEQRNGIRTRYLYVVRYMTEIGGLIKARAQEQRKVETLKKLYGIH